MAPCAYDDARVLGQGAGGSRRRWRRAACGLAGDKSGLTGGPSSGAALGSGPAVGRSFRLAPKLENCRHRARHSVSLGRNAPHFYAYLIIKCLLYADFYASVLGRPDLLGAQRPTILEFWRTSRTPIDKFPFGNPPMRPAAPARNRHAGAERPPTDHGDRPQPPQLIQGNPHPTGAGTPPDPAMPPGAGRLATPGPDLDRHGPAFGAKSCGKQGRPAATRPLACENTWCPRCDSNARHPL